MGGLAALDIVKREKPEIKVIMVTAFGQDTKIMDARDKGASGYVRKPFTKEEIIAAVNTALSSETKSVC
jgi:DNA-binding NarL/FixJ family response regulator